MAHKHIDYSKQIDTLHNYGLDIHNRIIYLFGEEFSHEDDCEPGIEYRMSNRFIKNLDILSDINNKPILIKMKTNGGYVEEGMAIFEAIKQCQCPISILNLTHAQSMSSIVLQAADFRSMMPYSYAMIHKGLIEYSGNVEGSKAYMDWENKMTQPMMFKIYTDRMKETGTYKGQPVQKIKKYLQEQMREKTDVYMTASKTVEIGLADEIFDGDWNKFKKIKKIQWK